VPSVSTYPKGFDACQDEVEGMMRVGESLGGVEATIDSARITDDERAALWLLAWSMRDGIAHGEDARTMLERQSIHD
jgi:hypothetical protein